MNYVTRNSFMGRDGSELPLVLASSSPRRRDLLPYLGLPFKVNPPQIEEKRKSGETPKEMVIRLAIEKASVIAQQLSAGLVIGADSVVVFGPQVLGKPKTITEAVQMLEMLRGGKHRVMTGVSVIDVVNECKMFIVEETIVSMREYSRGELEKYAFSGGSMDKAGAYAIQDSTFSPVAQVNGCYTNAVGLPLCRLSEMLGKCGISVDSRVSAIDRQNCFFCKQARGYEDWTS